MPANKGVVIGGAAAILLLLLGSKKASAKSSSGTGGTGGTGGKSEQGKGDVGEPAGPNGCKTGLVIKDGVCSVPDGGTGGTGGGNGGGSGGTGGGGGNLKSSDLYISTKCDTFKFGDKIGDAWWKAKGKSKAKDWVESGYKNLVLIAYQMIRKTNTVCFENFPIQEKYKNAFDLYVARIDWILKYPAMWTLLYTIRNKIDQDILTGLTLVRLNDKWKLEFGKGYNFEDLWEALQPLAYTIFYAEQQKPGSVLNKFGYTYPKYDDSGNTVVNTVMVLYAIMFSTGTDKKQILAHRLNMFKEFTVSLDKTTFYGYLWDKVADMEGLSLDLEFDPNN